jgi:hypothetical protein
MMLSSGDIRLRGFNGYHAVKQVGGAGDTGRSVIGLCSPDGCQVIWDKPLDPAGHNLAIAGWRSFTDTDPFPAEAHHLWLRTGSLGVNSVMRRGGIKKCPHSHG